MVVFPRKNGCISSQIFKIQCSLQEDIFALSKQYKREKEVANEVLENDRHEQIFYESIDQWLCQANQVMKHVTTLVNDGNVP